MQPEPRQVHVLNRWGGVKDRQNIFQLPDMFRVHAAWIVVLESRFNPPWRKLFIIEYCNAQHVACQESLAKQAGNVPKPLPKSTRFETLQERHFCAIKIAYASPAQHLLTGPGTKNELIGDVHVLVTTQYRFVQQRVAQRTLSNTRSLMSVVLVVIFELPSTEFLSKSDEKPFRPADVAEPIRVFILDYFAYQLRTVLAEPFKRLVDIVHGEHDPEVA